MTTLYPDLAPIVGELAEHTSVVSRMHAIANRSREVITWSRHEAPADPNIIVRSWKIKDDVYLHIPSPLPTRARGLFTRWLPAHDGQAEGGEGGHWRVVARGYDKFFDIDETEWTSWSSLGTHTEGPYDLTLMSNGCLILIAPLTPDKLLVTSKNATGSVNGHSVSHSQMAGRWLDKHLDSVGKTQADLAARLWKDNWTVVCDLCDDAFEEHVLPTAPDQAGLRLHGINTSKPAFETQPQEVLEAFAQEWGLVPTPYLTLNSVAEVLKFTEECANTGSWNGEDIKGFVVRTRVKDSQNELHGIAHKGAPPCPPGTSFFFKVKFDAPYTIFRDFREITKMLLRGSRYGDSLRVPKSKLRRPETRLYTHWVVGEIKRDRRQFNGFQQSHGIIATRNRFFEWLNTEDGKKAFAAEYKLNGPAPTVRAVVKPAVGNTVPPPVQRTVVKPITGLRSKWVVYPVGIPGCGKTTLAVALSHIFGFAHTQSDDVKAKRIPLIAPNFLANVANLLHDYDVVIADKNNHLSQHRWGLRKAVANMRPPVKLLALNWATVRTAVPQNTVHRICAERVVARGSNHQTLIPGAHGTHEDVLWRFLDESDDLAEDEFDACIEMEVEESLEDALERAVDGIVGILGLPEPSQEQIDEALRRARAYQAATKATSAPPREYPRYYALLPEADFTAIAGRRILAADVPKELKDLWRRALAHTNKKHSLVAVRPQVKLAREELTAPDDLALWDRCAALAPGAMFRLGFHRLVYDGRVVAAVFDDIRPVQAYGGAGAFVQKLPESVFKRLHVTVARRDASVLPEEAEALVEEWSRNPSGVKTIVLSEPADVLARVRGFAN